MATFDTLTTQCRYLLQDVGSAPQAWNDAEIRAELDAAMSHWSRREGVAEWVWVQAVANQRRYDLNAQGLHLQQGTDNSGGTDTLTTVTDTTVDFTTTVVVGDRVRNYTDGSIGTITTVAATIVTCSAGFTGGINNSVDNGDAYGIERPVIADRVAAIDTVLYNGRELHYATPAALDRLTQTWERRPGFPKYWSLGQGETPTTLMITPAPLTTGSSVPVIPMAPLAQAWEENLVVLMRQHPQQTQDADEEIRLVEALYPLLVHEAASRLAGFEGEWQHLAVQVACQQVAAAYQRLWEAPRD